MHADVDGIIVSISRHIHDPGIITLPFQHVDIQQVEDVLGWGISLFHQFLHTQTMQCESR